MPKRKSSAIEDVITAAENKGYRVYPTAQRYIKNSVKKAQINGLVHTPREANICAAALVSAGIEKAIASKVRFVTVGNIKQGWDKLMACPGNTPPHKCFSKTVLGRVDVLRTTMPIFEEILDKVDIVKSEMSS
jgi:hypothetical protein